jgi:hypothetical protein
MAIAGISLSFPGSDIITFILVFALLIILIKGFKKSSPKPANLEPDASRFGRRIA